MGSMIRVPRNSESVVVPNGSHDVHFETNTEVSDVKITSTGASDELDSWTSKDTNCDGFIHGSWDGHSVHFQLNSSESGLSVTRWYFTLANGEKNGPDQPL